MFSPPLKGFSTNCAAGLTVIELMVVMVIFTVITVVALANLPAFRAKNSLDLLAEEMALTIRQAQVFSVSVRGIPGAEVFPSYGVAIKMPEQNTLRSNFVLFSDTTNTDGRLLYERLMPDEEGFSCGGSGDQCREVFQFQGGVGVASAEYCVVGSSGDCTSIPLDPSGEVLQIIFTRPYPDASFKISNSGDPDSYSAPTASYVRIVLGSARDPLPTNTRNIIVWQTGHIYACKPQLGSAICSQ